MRSADDIRAETERMQADLADGGDVTSYSRKFSGSAFDSLLERANADRTQADVMRAWLDQFRVYLDAWEKHVPVVEVRRPKQGRSSPRFQGGPAYPWVKGQR